MLICLNTIIALKSKVEYHARVSEDLPAAEPVYLLRKAGLTSTLRACEQLIPLKYLRTRLLRILISAVKRPMGSRPKSNSTEKL